MRRIAIYPGTFDPLTKGHADLVERAIKLFDQVIVAVAVNTSKQCCFTAQQRVDLATEVLAALPQVEVCCFDRLLVDFARHKGASVIVRGVRAVSDFDYEFQMAGMNRRMAPAIETIFLMPSAQYVEVSASLIREIASLGGDITPFVAPQVVAALKRLGEKGES